MLLATLKGFYELRNVKLHRFLTLTLGGNEWGVSLWNSPRYTAEGMLHGPRRRSWLPPSRLWTLVIQPIAFHFVRFALLNL